LINSEIIKKAIVTDRRGWGYNWWRCDWWRSGRSAANATHVVCRQSQSDI